MNSFRNQQYSITTSLNERTIHIKVVNNISYMSYEGNFDSSSIKFGFELSDTYNLITKCFANFVSPDAIKLADYTVSFTLDNGILRTNFNCMVGGVLRIQFDLRLREKLLSNDAQLTIDIQRIEQTYQSEIDKLTKKLEDMEKYIIDTIGMAEICFTNSTNNVIVTSFPINIKEIDLNCDNNKYSLQSFKQIENFIRLETLRISTCNWVNIMYVPTPHPHMSNKTLKKLIIHQTNHQCNLSFLKYFPNLEEFKMEGCSTTFESIDAFKDIPNKLKVLEFITCANIGTIQSSLTVYCSNNNIKLIIS